MLDPETIVSDDATCLIYSMRLAKIYSAVEKRVGNVFARYGRFVARHPIKIVIIVIIINGALGVGMVKLQQKTNTEDVYIPTGMFYKSLGVELFITQLICL